MCISAFQLKEFVRKEQNQPKVKYFETWKNENSKSLIGIEKKRKSTTKYQMISGKKNSKQDMGFGAEEKIIKEERRVRRIKMKMQQTVCYCCRKKGHTLANCKRNNDSQKLGVCFKCGSLEHTLKNCKSKANGLPYAYCFVCNGHGHLAKSCKENPNGIYPNGGSCKKCGSIYHLVKDCEKHSNESSVVAASKLATFESADADLSPIKCEKSAKREKIVKF
ncbi:Zinc finger CCHC domain-containing protein [Trichinella pseudospiralis]